MVEKGILSTPECQTGQQAKPFPFSPLTPDWTAVSRRSLQPDRGRVGGVGLPERQGVLNGTEQLRGAESSVPVREPSRPVQPT